MAGPDARAPGAHLAVNGEPEPGALPIDRCDWLTMAVLGAVLWTVQLSYHQLCRLSPVLAGLSHEGVVSGWWWSLSMLWLIDGVRRSSGRPRSARRWILNTPFRAYLAVAFTTLAVLQFLAQGAPAALGFLCGAGAVAAMYCLGELVKIGILALHERPRRVRAARAVSHEPIQLSLPFA